jgi:glycosyltransferase involved in cell wall biosynthesis
MRTRPRVLYVVYWGAAEPLGQSLVLPSVKRLAGLGVDLSLVTFEKPRDLEREGLIRDIRDSLAELGIRWIPLRYHKRPKMPATAFDLAHGCARSIANRLMMSPDIIHARTFIGGLMGLVLAPLLGARLIFHNEGFYPDEQVDAGVWRAGSVPHRIAGELERIMYARADGIIVMSNRAKEAIESMPAVRHRGTPVVVVPSCVDLDHFKGTRCSKLARQNGLRLVYIGSVGGRYILDRIARFTAIASEMLGDVRLRVLTRAEPGLVASMLESGRLKRALWSLDCVSRERMPEELAGQDAGLFFLTRGLSEHGCSPTKIGEYWAMGLPVVTTPNVSDTDAIIRRDRVGVIVNGHSDTAYRDAVGELQLLLNDSLVANRCRRAAESHYGLAPACERQVNLYHQVIHGGSGAAAAVTGGREAGDCPSSLYWCG